MAVNNYKNIKKADVRNVKAGYTNEVFLAPRAWFLTLAEPDPLATDELSKTIVDDHVFVDPLTMGFIKVHCQPNKNTMTGTSVGEVGAKWMEYLTTFQVQGDTLKQQVLFEQILNDDLIVLVKDTDCPTNTVWQVGCECDGNVEEMKMDGKTKGDTTGKSWTVSVKSSCRYVYAGTIHIMPD